MSAKVIFFKKYLQYLYISVKYLEPFSFTAASCSPLSVHMNFVASIADIDPSH